MTDSEEEPKRYQLNSDAKGFRALKLANGTEGTDTGYHQVYNHEIGKIEVIIF